MASPSASSTSGRTRRPPAMTAEAREQELTAMAIDLVEKQIRDGSVSAQVLSHYVKLSSPRERLEREKLESENLMLRARVTAMEQQALSESTYVDALNAMRRYSGQEVSGDSDYDA